MPRGDEYTQLLASELIGPAALGKDAVPMGAIVIVEYLDEDGEVTLHYRRSADTTTWKALGMCKMVESLLLDTSTAVAIFDDTDEPFDDVDDVDDE